jgi:hypothetical protein
VLGLPADLPRRNCWSIAEQAGDATPDGMQHLLAQAMLNAWPCPAKALGELAPGQLDEDPAALQNGLCLRVRKAYSER